MSRVLLRISILGAVAALLTAGLSAGETASFSIIVHPSNSVGAMKTAEVSRLFLRQSTRWESGQRALPVNLVAQSPLRQRFTREINQKSLAAEKAYWQRQIFSGRAVPPLEVASEDDVLDYVAKNPGAVGYVSRGRITEQVRELQIRDAETRRE